MARIPTTNPQIDGKPLSFVKLKSRYENNPLIRQTSEGLQRMVEGKFIDSRGVPYVVKEGTVYRVKKD